ncbi:MAG: galactose mutarotase [Oscillospiraceae bacterium]|nr:galactose mutarotase [Oscillospiraceae bacterium]
MIRKENFYGTEKYILLSDTLEVSTMKLGATCLSIKVNSREVILGFDTLEGYKTDPCHIGVIVGRYGNRIAKARGMIDGKEITLEANENGNQLHGGPKGFDKQEWTVAYFRENENGGSIRYEYFSPDGENGYPGNLHAAVIYTVNGSKLTMEFEGISDADTFFAPTTHMYFNLSGRDTVLETAVKINSQNYLEVDDELIPTSVKQANGDFDFRCFRPIHQAYDHCFIIDKDTKDNAFEAKGDGINLVLNTDYPALQFYTGKKLKPPHHAFQGFAIEPEAYPDSPNRPDFPSSVLRAGEKYHRQIVYSFSSI